MILMNESNKSIKLNFLMNALLQISAFVFPLISFPYISRVLLPEGVGKVNMACSFVAYFQMVAQLGIPTYAVKECAKVRNDKTALTKTVKELLRINFFMVLVSYIMLAALVIFIPKLREEKLLYIVVSLNILFGAIGIEWLYQALEEYTYITVRSVISKAVALAAMFLLVRSKSDYVVYAAISVFANGTAYMVNFINARRYVDLKSNMELDVKRHIRPVLVFFALVCTITIYTNLDNVMLGFMTTDADVGYYSTAVKIKTLLVSLITSLGTVMLPRASYYVEHGLIEDFKKITKRAMHFVVLTAVPVTVYFTIYAKESIRFIAGPAYEGAVLPMQLIMPTVLFIGITNLLGIEIMVPTGREKQVVYSTAVGAVTDLILNAVLIPRYAATGAAMGTLCAELAVLIYQCICLKDEAREAFSEVSWLFVIAGTVLGGMAAYLIKGLSFSLFTKLAVSAIVFFGVYGIMSVRTIKLFITMREKEKKAQ